MKVIVMGGTGTIGGAVVAALKQKHDVVVVGKTTGDIKTDMTNVREIEAMYREVGRIDAVVITLGNVHFDALPAMTAEKYNIGLQNKLLGSVNLVLTGLHYMNDGGSFTLTSGILNREFIAMGSGAAMVNGALDGFVKAAACEMPRGIRINIVSPTVVEEAMDVYADYFPGFIPVPAARVAKAYVKSVEGIETGRIYCVGSL
ncbi:MAG: short chain dehydrogenase [Coxiella sp. RIFCSPHIGHO2_12_FULL_44_14]|nr:MAG: short chain dehydrogenase [Coxiella sp. RIFCSPHIGHO2_12_FULL_44_14]